VKIKLHYSYKMGLLFAVIYMLAEVILLFLDKNRSQEVTVFSFALSTLCMLLAVAISVLVNFNRNKSGGLSMLEDIKAGLKTSAVYALTIAAFITFYYVVLDPGYTEYRKKEYVDRMQDAEALKELGNKMAENPYYFDGKSKSDIQEMNMDGVNYILDPFKAFPITLFSLLMLGMVYTFVIMALNRLVLSKL
jgi:hypothetical protein